MSDQFIHSYSKVLVNAWTDPSFLGLLESNPVAVLKAQGLVTKKGATVKIVTDFKPKEANIDDQVKAWEQGDKTGVYTLYIPAKPQLGMETSSAVGDSYCCCCCPCCTCT